MEGFEDPFNRRTFPWGEEDGELLSWFRALGRLRGSLSPLRRGELEWLTCRGRVVSFARSWEGETVIAGANAGDHAAFLELPGGGHVRLEAMTAKLFRWDGTDLSVLL